MSTLRAKSLRYFVAIAATIAALAVRFMLEPFLGDVAPFLVFTLSVTVAAWYGGWAPGLLATALSVVFGNYFFLEPRYSILVDSGAHRAEEILFLGISASISILCHTRLSLLAKRQQLLTNEQNARRAAEEANQLKDHFLSTVSHELRTPLTAINGWAQLLSAGTLNDTQAARAVKSIVRNAKSQTQLINDLLDISRMIAGKMRLDIASVNLGLVIHAAVEAIHPAAEAKNIRLRLLLDPVAEVVSGDAERLQQVVWNLLSNAIKFAPKGGYVEVRLERVNSHAEIVVTDNGHGIKPEFLPYVFERFRQQEGGTNREQGGLGLGLAIVRHIVELHGGTVHAASEGLGKGAAFIVALPITSVRSLSPHKKLRAKAAGESVADQNTPSLTGVKVLFVDDDADARELVATMLTLGSADVRTADSAAEALASLDEWRPDILISDIGMPGEDGYMLMKKLRQRAWASGKHIPAIALTAYGRREDRLHALSAGYELHIPKPVDPDELLAVVASLTCGQTDGRSRARR